MKKTKTRQKKQTETSASSDELAFPKESREMVEWAKLQGWSLAHIFLLQLAITPVMEAMGRISYAKADAIRLIQKMIEISFTLKAPTKHEQTQQAARKSS